MKARSSIESLASGIAGSSAIAGLAAMRDSWGSKTKGWMGSVESVEPGSSRTSSPESAVIGSPNWSARDRIRAERSSALLRLKAR